MPGVKGRCGGKREGAGRKPSGDAEVFVGFRTTKARAEWLKLWGDTPTKAMNYFFERGEVFWPDGPGKAGATKNRKRKK